MMRILMAALLGAAMVFSVAAPAAAAPTKEEQELVLLKKKKKKLDAELRAKEAAVKAKATKQKVVVVKKKSVRVVAKKPLPEKKQVARRADCVGFFNCVFGKRDRNGVRVQRRSGFQNASLGGVEGLSSRTTRKTISWDEAKYSPGSLIIRTSERALYYVSGNGKAIRYSVGVGREGMQWSGQNRISRKAEWPGWTPPAEMIKREAEKGHILPPFMEGGPGNPLGARALYIGGGVYRVHGTNNEDSIGGAVSSGCIRMMNADVIDLYDRVKIGARIYVY
jgi:lipoprotein-anchoring transpeptidase ErfK/SrfK